MGTMNAGAWVQKGERIGFDILQGVIEEVKEAVERADIPVEFHVGDGPIPEGYTRVGPEQHNYMQ